MFINFDSGPFKLIKGAFRSIEGMAGNWCKRVVLIPCTQYENKEEVANFSCFQTQGSV
jgi:hypothetical protein